MKIMPTYDYKCPKCDFKMEVAHSMTCEKEINCLICMEPMQKGFGGGVGIHFKGSGFYETDYKGK